MNRRLRMALAAGALFAMLVAASPVVVAESRAANSACVAHHARAEGGFSGSLNPGMHRGVAGSHEICSHT